MNGPLSKSTMNTSNKFISNPKAYLKMPKSRKSSLIDKDSKSFVENDPKINMGFEKKSPVSKKYKS